MSERESYADFTNEMLEIVSLVRESWSEKELSYILQDIDYREWDLAIEGIAGTITALKKDVTETLQSKINVLAAKLDLTDSPYILELNTYATYLRA